MTTLQDRLSALADAAPTELPDGLWERGLRYRRRRRIPTITVVVLAVLLAAAATLLAIGRTGAAPEPAETKDVPFEALHLPRTFYQPSPWAAGTTEPPGPLAAIASAPRLKRTGPFGVRQTGSAYGISAIDGSTTFLDLFSFDPESPDAPLLGQFPVLSPDGRKLAFVRSSATFAGRGGIDGWGVYDLVTGKTITLEDSAAPKPREGGFWFSGDSRYLITRYAPSASYLSPRRAQVVAWDLSRGTKHLVEGDGFLKPPVLGYGPSGIAWARGHRIYHHDVVSGRTASVTARHEVTQPTYGPDGRFLAYATRRGGGIYAGTDVASMAEVDTGARGGSLIMGWQNAQTLAVMRFGHDLRDEVWYVDVMTGTKSRAAAAPDYRLSFQLARALWANDLVPGKRPPEIRDPRWVTGGLAAAGILLPSLALALRWRRRVRP